MERCEQSHSVPKRRENISQYETRRKDELRLLGLRHFSFITKELSELVADEGGQLYWKRLL